MPRRTYAKPRPGYHHPKGQKRPRSWHRGLGSSRLFYERLQKVAAL